MTGYHVGTEGRSLLLEDNGDDIVADVSFSLELLRVAGTVGQKRCDVEEYLSAAEDFVDRGVTGLSVTGIESAAIALVILEVDPLTEKIEKLLESRGYLTIAEELLLGDLASSLMEYAELEAGHQGVLVVARDQCTRARAHNWH